MPATPSPADGAPAAFPGLLALMFAAVEQASEAIVITTADLDAPGPTMLYVNPAFVRMSGFSVAEAVGHSPRIMQGPNSDAEVLARLRRHLERGDRFAGRTINYRKDGAEYTVDMQIAPIRDDAGVVTHFIGIQQDVSAQVHLEAELRRSQRLEAVGQLAGGVAHDFNNLLTVIGASLAFVRAEVPPTSPACADLDEAEAAARRAATLTRQLLAFGRRQRLEPRRVDANRAVGEVLGMLRRLVAAGVSIETCLAEDLWPIYVDQGQLEQVLVNLVFNARDAVRDAGGRITVTTANVVVDAATAERTPGLVRGEHVCLGVADTGPGIAPDVLPHLFEPFFTTKPVGQGTGLGLSTVYGIVQQSGGHVVADNRSGGGAVFTVYLPRDVGREADGTAYRAPAVGGQRVR